MVTEADKYPKRPVHIAFIHKDFPYGGAEKVTCDIADWLCAKGFSVSVMVMNYHPKMFPKGYSPSFHIHHLRKGRIKYSVKVAKAVRSYIITEKVDVLVTYRELLYASWLKRHTGVKLVYELHSMPFYEFIDIKEKKQASSFSNVFYSCGVERLLTKFYKSKYRRVYSWADAYGVLCNGFKSDIANILHLGKDNKLFVLPNHTEYPKHIVTEKQHTVIYVGRLSHRDKRVDRLLRIWHIAQPQLMGWQLKIVGSGIDESNLKEMSRRLQLRNISFEGYKSDVQPYYDEASILCLTSSFEGWGLVLTEAQANGVIPILFDSYLSAKDIVSNADEGILVRPFDEESFAKQLVGLALDERRMKYMQGKVIEKSKVYSLERSGSAWLKMLDSILEGNERL